MKTIESAALKYSEPIATYTYYNGMDNLTYCDLEKCMVDSFKAGARFAQEWISVDEKPDTPKRDEEGISYSDWLLIKVEGFEYPFIGYYVKANDYKFFDILPEVPEVVNQDDITHWRYIDLK